jgi:FkbM family methyltransferase
MIITRLKQIDPRAGTLRFPKDTDMMHNFWLTDAEGKTIRNTNHESSEQFLVHVFLRPDDAVLEFGGGLGANSIQICKTLGPQGRHMVFEPQDALAALIVENGRANGCDIDVFHGTLSKRPMYVPPFSPKRSDWLFVKADTTTRDGRRPVPHTTTLPFQPTVLVMDCEGAGLQILTDFPHVLDRVRFVYFENDGGTEVLRGMCALLRARDFRQVVNTSMHKAFLRP